MRPPQQLAGTTSMGSNIMAKAMATRNRANTATVVMPATAPVEEVEEGKFLGVRMGLAHLITGIVVVVVTKTGQSARRAIVARRCGTPVMWQAVLADII